MRFAAGQSMSVPSLDLPAPSEALLTPVETAGMSMDLPTFLRLFQLRKAQIMWFRRCGVFIAAVSDLETAPCAVVNVNCLDDRTRFTAPATMHEFQGETFEARTSRRAANWMPAVVRR
jgi:hypothetical protein